MTVCAGRGEEWWMGGEKVSECECNGRKKKICEGVKWKKKKSCSTAAILAVVYVQACDALLASYTKVVRWG